MILREHRLVEHLPRVFGHVGVESRKDDGPLRQIRNGADQHLGPVARSGRADDDHRMLGRLRLPACDQALDRHPAAGFEIGRLVARAEIGLHDFQKRLGARPVARLVGHVELEDFLRRDAFAAHFVHQAGKRIGKIVERRPGREVGLLLYERRDEADQFKPSAQRRHGLWKVGQRPRFAQTGQQIDLRKQPCRSLVEDGADLPGHAIGADDHMDPGKLLRGAFRAPGQQAGHHRSAIVDSQWNLENAGGWRGIEHLAGPLEGRVALPVL